MTLKHWQAEIPRLEKLFEHERVGLITDMDGTLAPIVPVPDDAAPTPRNRELLQELHTTLSLVAVVSGRAAADLFKRVNLPDLVYAGNHGLERWHDGQVIPSVEAAAYRENLEAAIHDLNSMMPTGMWIEDKQATLSIHYRDTQNPRQTAEDFASTLNNLAANHGLRVFRGRMIFELRPPLDIDKGTIFKALVEEHHLDAALYLGDDTTDADALRMAQSLRADGTCYSLALGVESDETPQVVLDSSDMLLSGVADVEAFLGWLLTTSKASVS